MNQSPPLYDMASALETLEPWLEQHLPDLEPVARRHFVHLVTGIIEQQSLLIRAIAAASPFQAEPESNYTQVQRIIRDTRLTLETVYYPYNMTHISSDYHNSTQAASQERRKPRKRLWYSSTRGAGGGGMLGMERRLRAA